MHPWSHSRFLAPCAIALMLLPSLSAAQINSPAAAAAAASSISKQVSTQEWLGPLSAIALSPFFGLACLSGAATYGPDWLQSRTALLGPNSPLNNPILFWTMFGLTVATSLPRFTKVSKPFALAAEKLEMYSAVIILIAMKFMSSGSGIPESGILESGILESGIQQSEAMVMTAGVATLPMDVLLSLIAALNIVVVNTIKLAIELLVWLIPFPMVDAFLEMANKGLAGALMALYAYSPLLATVINVCILTGCCLIFFRVKRHMAYMKELIMRPLIAKLLGSSVDASHFVGFLTRPWNGFPIHSAFEFSQSGVNGAMQLQHRGWTKHRTFSGTKELPAKPGILCDQLCIRIDGQEVAFDVRKGLDGRPALASEYA